MGHFDGRVHFHRSVTAAVSFFFLLVIDNTAASKVPYSTRFNLPLRICGQLSRISKDTVLGLLVVSQRAGIASPVAKSWLRPLRPSLPWRTSERCYKKKLAGENRGINALFFKDFRVFKRKRGRNKMGPLNKSLQFHRLKKNSRVNLVPDIWLRLFGSWLFNRSDLVPMVHQLFSVVFFIRLRTLAKVCLPDEGVCFAAGECAKTWACMFALTLLTRNLCI